MQKGLWSLIKRILADKRKHKIWLRIVSGMMALVVFCTTYALILPAITLERKTYCNLEEHTHTQECYGAEQVTKKSLTCDPLGDAEFVIHSHNEFCYDDDGSLICDLTELQEHIHTEDCYDSDGKLTCDLPQVEPHEHSDDCYVDGYLACGKPYVVEHEHTAECVQKEVTATEEQTLICGKVEHTHTEECYIEPTDEATSGASVSTTANTVASDKNTDKTAKQTASDKQTSATAVENKEIKELTFAYSDDEISGVITLNWDAKLPDDLECTVVKVNGIDDDEDYFSMNRSVYDALTNQNKKMGTMQMYRLEWTSNGVEYTLPSTVVPKVQLTSLNKNNDEATIVGAVITDKENTQVFKDESGINKLTDTDELETINNAVIRLFSADDESVEDDVTSGQAIDTNSIAVEDDTPMLANSGAIKAMADDSSEDLDIFNDDYTAETVLADNGSNSVELELTGTSTFAVLQAFDVTTVSGDYFKRVDSIDEIDDSTDYWIVFQNAVSVLYYDASDYSFKVKEVEINPVKGLNNREYFTFTDIDTHQSINTSNYSLFNFNIVRNVNDDKDEYDGNYYLMWNHWRAYQEVNSIGTFDKWDLTHKEQAGVWWIYTTIKNYKTDDDGNQVVSSAWSSTMGYRKSSNMLYATASPFGEQNILIFKYVGGSRDIEDDVEEVEEFASEEHEQMDKPDYATYQTVSGAKNQSDVLGSAHNAAGATVDCVSDPSTAQIESKLGMVNSNLSATEQFEAQEKNDGRLITDKSVVYGKDDYGAIPESDFDAGDFSVTLSALGQEWKIDDEQNDTIPIDVIFVLDVSGSMKNIANTDYYYDSTSGQYVYYDSRTRWMAGADAISEAMAAIQKKNENNRVGVIEFSNTSKSVIELGRYTADDDQFLDYSYNNVYTYDPDTKTTSFSKYNYQTLQVSDSLTDEATGQKSQYAGTSLYSEADGMFQATYTQRGIQEAYEMFARNNDTQYYLKTHNTWVKRQPVVILVTDGDPTYCSYNYMDPKSGPNYGNGGSYGIESFYTILSANYFKNLTSIHYGKQAAFYTIGMGILPEGYGNYYEVYYNYYEYRGYLDFDDSYRRAVLDPTAKNIEALNDYKHYALTDSTKDLQENFWKDTGRQLKWLLEESCLDSTETEHIDNGEYLECINDAYSLQENSDGVYDTMTDNSSSSGLGYTAALIRGMDNPYKDNYNYVDAAFFGNLSESELEGIFDSILQNVQVTSRYDFLLKTGTNVVITDPLGDGMMVKGKPMLSYFGTNYEPVGWKTDNASGKTVTTYNWSGTTVKRQTSDAKTGDDATIDLSGVLLTVETDSTTGAQTVTLTISESALPTFYPDNYEQFYYEELPIRAIFRVGLSTAEETKLVTDANGRSIRDKTYYTNKYDADSGTAGATVTFQPADGNPYYTDTGNKSSSIAKSENTSGTTSTYFTESVNSDGTVTQQLGNNGKLVLNKLNKSDITVEKKWEAKAPADSVSVELYATCKKYYAPTQYTSYSNVRVDTVELNAANNWKYTWNNIDMDWTEGNYDYTYTNFYVREVPLNTYATSYQDKNGDDLQLQEVTYTETDMSKLVVVTPPTTDEEEAEEEAEETESAESIKLSAHSAGMWGFPVTVNAVAASNGSTVTITNKDAYLLPNSGGNGTAMFTLSGLAVMLAATGLMYINKRRKNEQDNREAKY